MGTPKKRYSGKEDLEKKNPSRNENIDICNMFSEPRGFTEKMTKGRRKERQREPRESHREAWIPR